MKNKEITMIGLLQRIYNNNVPKKIKIDNDIWYFYKKNDGKISYIDNETSYWDSCALNFNYYIEENKLDTIVEILPEENEMKEMVYQAEFKHEVLYNGTYKDYEFYILNLGTHPTAYINVINNKLLAMKDYNDIDISVHGGLTYSEDYLYIDDKKEKAKGWFIGWDYAHYNDYAGYEMNMPEEIRTNGKKWTTKEIFEDVKSVIEQCIDYKENDEWEDIYTLGDIGEYHFMNRQNDMTQEDRRLLDSNFKILGETINQLIKNQKYLKEKMESKQ